MAAAPGIAEPIAPDDDLPTVAQRLVAELRATVAALQRRVADLESPPEDWQPLKRAASLCDIPYQTVRRLACAGLISARRDRSRWLIDVTNLKARQQRR
jgi:hypothetical protein